MLLMDYVSGVPRFFAYFGSAIALLVAFALLYTRMTPYHEWRLIKENNKAAATAFGGSLIGFVLPLSSAIAHSVNLVDCLIWGGIAFVIQVMTFYAIRMLMKDMSRRILEGELATGILIAATSIAVGLLNAACMTY